eukprot:TRINITY_DN1901_c5_g1_i1.p1 TRINITY_DN1901_c5_g1~~TRINITY_DN1901_c5_g1_i1.p1  ORF type:complete len:418 (+),score=159.79 TRINITY_DN1901_c5_g1_i1:122-1375(+)
MAPLRMIALAVTAAATLATADQTEIADEPLDPLQVKLPTIPSVDSAGKDGLPELPSVGDMMTGASSTLAGINAKANELQSKMMAVQKENQARIQKQKAVFDKKLREQEAKNQGVIAENAKIAKVIMDLKTNNEKTLQRSKDLEKQNALRRKELDAFDNLLGKAQAFVEDSINSNDDSHAPELTILTEKKEPEKKQPETETLPIGTERLDQEPMPKVTLSSVKSKVAKSKEVEQKRDSDDGDDDMVGETDEKSEKVETEIEKADKDVKDGADDAEGDGEDLSFIEVEETVSEEPADAGAGADPEGLLTVLTKGVKDLKKEGRESEKKLKSLFLNSFKAGNTRHTALVAQQKVLKQTLTSMKAYGAKLQGAESHLKDTKGKLDKSLHNTGLVLQKLAKVAVENGEKAAKELNDMEKAAK